MVNVPWCHKCDVPFGDGDCNECEPNTKKDTPEVNDVDTLAQFIREIDGSNTMGAGELAEKIISKGYQFMPLPHIEGLSLALAETEPSPDYFSIIHHAARQYEKNQTPSIPKYVKENIGPFHKDFNHNVQLTTTQVIVYKKGDIFKTPVAQFYGLEAKIEASKFVETMNSNSLEEG